MIMIVVMIVKTENKTSFITLGMIDIFKPRTSIKSIRGRQLSFLYYIDRNDGIEKAVINGQN